MARRTGLILLILLLGFNLYSQKTLDYNTPKEYTIADITVSGIKFSSPEVLIQLSGLKVGEKISIPGEKITQAINNLWKHGLYANIKILATKIENEKVYLNIYLQDRPRLSAIVYSGIRKGEQDDLNEAIKLIRGTQVTENTILLAKNIIKKHYTEKGFFKSVVDIRQREDTTLQNTVILFIDIDKKSKTKINEIIVDGNKEFSNKKIRKALKETKVKRWYGLFKPSKYIETKFEEDKKKLIEKYNEEGFRDARIVADSIYNFNDKMINLFLKVEEGKKYYFRSFSWVGNTKYTAKELIDYMGIKKGDVYDQKRLENRLTVDEDAVGNLYMNDGYLFYNASPREVMIDGDSIDVQVVMYEGRQATYRNIIIAGNNRTNDHVVRRELYTVPGELFKKSEVIRSVRELAQLGNFDPEKIQPNPIPNPEDGTVDIEYNLTEKANDQLELSGGWGANMLVGTLGVSFNNFSTSNIFNKKAWQPLPTGDGQRLSVRAQTNGNRFQSYNMSFVEPWLGGKKPNSFTVSLYYTVQTNGEPKNSVYNKHMNTKGAALGLGSRLKWPDDYFAIYNELNFQNYNLKEWPYFPMFSNGNSNNFSYKIDFSRNSIDNPIYTRTGSSFSLSLQATPPYSLLSNKNYTTMPASEKYRWIEYHKWTFKGAWFIPLGSIDAANKYTFVLHNRVQYGFLGLYNKAYGHSPFEGFSLGGDGMSYYSFGTDVIGLRGYENDALTPKTGGNYYCKYTTELRFPIALNENATIYAMGFLEAGNIWTNFKDFNPFNINRSAGVGVRFFLPMLGQIGFDWGYGFDDIPGNPGKNKSQFHFVLGQQMY